MESIFCKHTIQIFLKIQWGVETPYPPLSTPVATDIGRKSDKLIELATSWTKETSAVSQQEGTLPVLTEYLTICATMTAIS